jgi:hypothetical protein
MQVHCKASDTVTDVRCNICGQGFLIYWTRSSAEDRATRAEIQQTLTSHHRDSAGPSAHPAAEFFVAVSPMPGYLDSLGAYA